MCMGSRLPLCISSAAFTVGPSSYNLRVVAARRVTWCRLWNMESLLMSYCEPDSCSYTLWADINIVSFQKEKVLAHHFLPILFHHSLCVFDAHHTPMYSAMTVLVLVLCLADSLPTWPSHFAVEIAHVLHWAPFKPMQPICVVVLPAILSSTQLVYVLPFVLACACYPRMANEILVCFPTTCE